MVVEELTKSQTAVRSECRYLRPQLDHTSMRQVRQPRYQTVAAEIRALVGADDTLLAGSLLPSEADLAQRYGVSRVTVRRALDLVRDEGLIDSRQGLGWFVASDPVRQTLGWLSTIEEQLIERGLESRRAILDFSFVPATGRVREVLECETVLRVSRLNLSDGVPFARVTVWCPESLGSSFSRDQVQQHSFLDLLDVTLEHATQSIGAVAAADDDAELLGVPIGSPMLRCERITHARGLGAVLLSEFVFPGHLTEFMVELATPAASIAPTGLRLVGRDPA